MTDSSFSRWVSPLEWRGFGARDLADDRVAVQERLHPGAQLTFTALGGMRDTAFLTDAPPRVVDGNLAGLGLRHREHARVEDCIRQAKPPDCATCPARGWNENAAWLEVVLTAGDLVA